MLQRTLLLFLFILGAYFPHSQQRYKEQHWLSLYHKAEALYSNSSATDQTDSIALSLYKQVIELLSKNGEADTVLLDAYLKTGILSMSHGQSNEAIEFFHDAIRAKIKHPLLGDTLLFKPYLYAGSAYYDMNNLDSAYQFYKKAENILLQFPTVTESERLYNKMGALYYATGDYRKSIPYFTKALSTVESKQPSDFYFIVNYKNNIASALRKIGYTDSAVAIYKELLPLHINENELFHNIGFALLDEGKNTEALFYLEKASYESASRYNHIAQACLRLGQYEKAKNYLDHAFQAYQKKGNPPHDFDDANTLWIAGDLAMMQGKAMEAIHLYQQSIIQLKPDFTDTSVYSNPVSFLSMNNSFVLFDVLVSKAKAFATINEDGALHAFQTYEAALTLAKRLELQYQSDETRLFLNNKVTPACRDAVDLGIVLIEKTNDPAFIDKIFRWCESNKASVLQAGLYALQLDSLSSLPSGILKESKTAKALLAKLNLQFSFTNDSVIRETIGKKITDIEIQLAALHEKLEENPAYQQLIFSSHETAIDSIRKSMMPPDEAILSFYYTRHHLINFYITKETNGVIYTPLADSFGNKIIQYHHELDAGETGDKEAINYLSSYLFSQLVQPVFEKIKLKKHLVIIPYNEISYVPFESLINPGKEFLLNDFAVSYQYSANFLKGSSKKISSQYGVLAFAPFAHATGGAGAPPALPASRAEIESLKGIILYDSAATKTRFAELSSRFPVIHLATHAKANDFDPVQSYIEFYNGSHEQDTAHRLYEQEIYHLDMKSAQLVILSACETGSGQLVNGEGIMSLSRAFSYAGCPAVITSLWRAEDKATSFISTHLHKYLVNGESVDDALQQAKKDYLQSTDIPFRYKSPAFWANLILIGEYHPVHETGLAWIWLVAGSVFFALLFIFLMYKKRNGRV